jgi:multidrug efflux pump subunit AcrA (membrane-fusion protein)
MSPNSYRLLTTVFALSLVASQAWGQTADPVINAVVKFKQDQDKELPAKEPGVLVKLTVKQGDKVEAGQTIGLVDDTEPQMQKKVADYARAAAYKRAKDDVEVRFAKAQAAVAEKDYEKLVETNQRAARAVTDVELRRAKLDWDRAVLAIEKAGHEQELAKFEYFTKGAEYEAAEKAIERRAIVAPFGGEVVELHRKQDEWVNPGDPILRLARRDIMEVEGAVAQSDYDRSQVRGCNVTVEVQLAGGRSESLSGRIVYVSPVVRYDGMYLVRAEVPNREEAGDWMLPDGQPAKMTIHLNTAGAPTAELTRRP